ncbi:GNAT family N-acetyltransferase [Streptomyces ipomoeae]|jgi:ribosomal protein S18 acetylase RimI-like enzyme|uniref:Acetyltransferase, GNAT family n=2 Tax=Streptomyces ipomoeae TaxID=103232 RepID=L1KQL2_9ACTN|nr:GNAT family N-acetyltransferase [Streptomyces ipomoeae]EKX62673.1 acetyltransferase, GNAT family [Streptomyces ipomoeae 91-03]MDX2696576.1 GNAT family N-acetyltransferase [Streptomyces ipomoeae]MDX2823176.1 GNAT family N-acetyltransferase [Streptomyces ipomoeae]MDX2841309.1 GNAT family N-acetyltransferase [Streptomyces ipomoeae]MDX2876733.1 GNAT family N-acetyltransferase [Streptomyces ipomoeae]
MNDTLRIRRMTLADCRPVAEIRVGGWQTAYAGLIPQPYLDAMDVAQDTERRRELLLQPGNPVVSLVAERAGQVIGWAAYGPHRDGEVHTENAELYALYVRPGHFGSGVGSALLRESIARCTTAGHERMLLWVLKENTRARRFYEHHGFTPDGTEEPFEVDGVEVPEVRYVRGAL